MRFRQIAGALSLLGAATLFSGATSAFANTLPSAPYTVKSGDSTLSLADMSGVGQQDFERVNGLSNASQLAVGEQVAMPFLYKVDQGDQLAYLAKVYDTTVMSISQLNHLSSDVLHRGQVLLIARGSAQIHPLSIQHMSAPTTTAKLVQSPVEAMVATSYDASYASNGSWGAVDYFGNPLKFGDIAVDPRVIPLGSKVWVSGYSDPALPKGGFYGTAVDTGGAIKGSRIDIFLPSTTAADRFGIEHVRVQVISN